MLILQLELLHINKYISFTYLQFAYMDTKDITTDQFYCLASIYVFI